MYMLAYWRGLLACLNGTEPSLMLLVTPALFLLGQVKMSTVRTAYSWGGNKPKTMTDAVCKVYGRL